MASPALGGGRITRERYWHLVEDGTIGPDDRVELLEGVIVAMAPQSPPHAFVIAKLSPWLTTLSGVSVRVQLPLDLNEDSTPEPDIAVVAGRPEDYAVAHPTHALLVVEVADSSVIQDRLTKAPIYAAAGIEEYWLVNLRERCVEVFRRPAATERRYTERRIAKSGDVLELALRPNRTIAVGELLPPLR